MAAWSWEAILTRQALPQRNALRAARDELARTGRVVTTSEIAASFAHEIDQPLSAIVVNASTGL
jgi:C4-dicarboxylate-specific signal transduction histidine kinase